ncbi:MAG: hypothetical protein CME71_11755 [Halobacteriovorax sp.]|nr:hypothetical protein [Halobacteriovorax sp.]
MTTTCAVIPDNPNKGANMPKTYIEVIEEVIDPSQFIQVRFVDLIETVQDDGTILCTPVPVKELKS